MAATFYDVHTWPDSQCNLCHLSSNPDVEGPELLVEDPSRLCVSCHTGLVTDPNDSVSVMGPNVSKNHPVKFSPLDFDSEKINHNIIRRENNFYVSGPGGEVRLYGDTLSSAVMECSSCHDPHGKTGLPSLNYTENSAHDLCLICHINMKNTLVSAP